MSKKEKTILTKLQEEILKHFWYVTGKEKTRNFTLKEIQLIIQLTIQHSKKFLLDQLTQIIEHPYNVIDEKLKLYRSIKRTLKREIKKNLQSDDFPKLIENTINLLSIQRRIELLENLKEKV